MTAPSRRRITSVRAHDFINRLGNRVHVHRHKTHVHAPEQKSIVVLERTKDVREPGGTRENPKNEHHDWKVEAHEHTMAAARALVNHLREKGKAAIIEVVKRGIPDRTLEQRADSRDKTLRQERRD